ncbi:MAG: NAD(P) transhydrogenase subunit alpha [Acidimicrobiaceae bacterium]|nr:NAD(P) transhydrogenase subunit alpha [Acidimicrobiaceae bacterium]MXW98184.1 NAD(P) transhydrogenase subunit alpha [Acidimicrobiaceae bacterium]MYB85809.1 NAD(P) transhydrogenase subunit alpha [Acidimicrobiaceae bacterium]MYE09791.1 NAD(P) transhydrogenase subunit alpha [Acidimicrobiaceae bacterium]MYH94132.1 NAD(P) transhydrogenase subunit alpha [Acidimicrobiaceae bacterium]
MDLLIAVTLFVLAVFLGVELITKVPPTLHTPLMSGSNAISGITIVGALVAAGADHSTFTAVLGFAAVTLAMINVVGGFLVTHRMLGMFGPKRRRDTSAQDRAASSAEGAGDR